MFTVFSIDLIIGDRSKYIDVKSYAVYIYLVVSVKDLVSKALERHV